jgi:hypothetical protein
LALKTLFIIDLINYYGHRHLNHFDLEKWIKRFTFEFTNPILMSEPQLQSQYEFNMSGALITLGFTTDNQIYTRMMMIKKTAPLDSLSSVTIKKGVMTSKLQYDIRIRKKDKEQIFQVVQIDSADEQGIRFVNDLKARMPASCVWNDKMEAKTIDVKDSSASRTYDLQTMWFIKGKMFAGYGRTFQIIMSYGLLTFCTIGIAVPLLIYVFAAGCHRVNTDENGISVKKLGKNYFSWEDVERIEATKYNVIVTNYGQEVGSSFLLRFNLLAKSGKKCEFLIRSLEGKNFVKEMIERKKMTADAASMFI